LSSFGTGGFSSSDPLIPPLLGLDERWARAFDNKIAEIPIMMKLTTMVERFAFFILISSFTMVERFAFFILISSFISACRLSYWPLTHSIYLLDAVQVFVAS
jgi:hypothetical protein